MRLRLLLIVLLSVAVSGCITRNPTIRHDYGQIATFDRETLVPTFPTIIYPDFAVRLQGGGNFNYQFAVFDPRTREKIGIFEASLSGVYDYPVILIRGQRFVIELHRTSADPKAMGRSMKSGELVVWDEASARKLNPQMHEWIWLKKHGLSYTIVPL